MSRIGKITLSALALGLALGVAGPGVYAQTASQGDLNQMIVNAKTPADHEAIAKQYDALAAKAKNQAEMHAKMGQNYKQVGGAAVGKYNLIPHCETLSKNAASDATQYQDLAAAHREMAKQAK